MTGIRAGIDEERRESERILSRLLEKSRKEREEEADRIREEERAACEERVARLRISWREGASLDGEGVPPGREEIENVRMRCRDEVTRIKNQAEMEKELALERLGEKLRKEHEIEILRIIEKAEKEFRAFYEGRLEEERKFCEERLKEIRKGSGVGDQGSGTVDQGSQDVAKD